MDFTVGQSIYYLFIPMNIILKLFDMTKNNFPDCRRLLQEYVIKQPVKNRYLTESNQNIT